MANIFRAFFIIFLRFFYPPHLGAARGGVALHFRAGSGERLLAEKRPAALLRPGAQEPLDRAVFDAMKGDDDEAPARRQMLPRGPQAFFRRAQLVVDGDAQSLERLRRGVEAPAAV